MRQYIEVGSAPAEENCAQVGSADYRTRALNECNRYIQRIRQVLGNEPEGADLKVKAFAHDFGTYYEVVCFYDDENEVAMDYAFRCEAEAPVTWE